jgi:hypothetical protein
MDQFTIQITQRIGKLLKSVSTTIQIARGAEADLDAIAIELESLSRALETLSPEANAWPQTSVILTNCHGVLEQIKRSLKKHTRRSILGVLQCASAGKDEMNALRSSFEAHKTSIMILLGGIDL